MALLIKARALLAIAGGSASNDIERCGGSSVKAKKLPPKREQCWEVCSDRSEKVLQCDPKGTLFSDPTQKSIRRSGTRLFHLCWNGERFKAAFQRV